MTKNNFKLSTRLNMIASIVPKGVNFADIGADHGHLIGYLMENNLISNGYASDNKEGPYNILKENLKDTSIKVDLVDGIRNIPEDINCVCIAGMGGDTIIKILKEGYGKLKNVDYLVISAHGMNDIVRRFLFDNGYHLVNQDACFDPSPMYYEVNLFKKGYASYDSIDIKYGRFLIKNNNLPFVYNIQQKILKIASLLQNENLPAYRLMEMQDEMNEYQELINIYERERAN